MFNTSHPQNSHSWFALWFIECYTLRDVGRMNEWMDRNRVTRVTWLERKLSLRPIDPWKRAVIRCDSSMSSVYTMHSRSYIAHSHCIIYDFNWWTNARSKQPNGNRGPISFVRSILWAEVLAGRELSVFAVLEQVKHVRCTGALKTNVLCSRSSVIDENIS
jgi:hypothetical protein